VADEMGRGRGVVEELLEDGSVERQLHDSIVGHFAPNVRHFCRALSGIRVGEFPSPESSTDGNYMHDQGP
jgi:hypothetical protein